MKVVSEHDTMLLLFHLVQARAVRGDCDCGRGYLVCPHWTKENRCRDEEMVKHKNTAIE